MSYATPYHWGPSQTPLLIKALIFLTCAVSIFSALTSNLFTHVFGIISPQSFLSLTWYGLHHQFYWQPLTYLFVQASSIDGIDLFYLISLAFNMYILWAFGTPVHERVGSRHFLGIYLVSGILAGLAAWLIMPLIGRSEMVSGPASAILAVFIVWSMLYPDSDLMLFFFIPIKAKWLVAGVLGGIFLINLSQVDLISLTYYGVATLCGYLYGVWGLNLHSPFSWTKPLDVSLINLKNFFQPGKSSSKTQIYDFTSGELILEDDAFVDAMLSKISRYGEKSLTNSERNRMQQISARKMKLREK